MKISSEQATMSIVYTRNTVPSRALVFAARIPAAGDAGGVCSGFLKVFEISGRAGVARDLVRGYTASRRAGTLGEGVDGYHWRSWITSVGRPTPHLLGIRRRRSPGQRWRLTMQRNSTIRATPWLMVALVLTLISGCTTVKTTGTARTGTEQLLLTGTWDDAICRVNFQPLAGAKVFVDGQYVANVDKEWIISSIRRTMAEQGVLLESNKDKAQVIVEVGVGVYGTDQRDTTTGLPGVGVGTSLTGPTLTSSAPPPSTSRRPTGRTRSSRPRFSAMT